MGKKKKNAGRSQKDDLILGIGIGYLLCHLMKSEHQTTQAPPRVPGPVIIRTPQAQLPAPTLMPRIGKRPWSMQNPLMYMAL